MSSLSHIARNAAVAMAILAMLGVALSGCSDRRIVPTLPDTHPATWMNQNSPDFHGEVVSLVGAESCAKCHGADWNGGKVGVSCVACHSQLTGRCTTCHGGIDNQTGAPPKGLRGEISDTTVAVGKHTVHLMGDSLVSVGIECNSCHHVPVFISDPQHIGFGPGAAADSIAEITWHGIADGGGAAWDRTARTCTGTYCHGNFAGGNHANAPVWTASSQAHCGSCHDIGITPSELLWKHQFHVGYAGLACADCHASVVDTSLTIVGLSLHVNGVVDTLTRDTTICAECHSPNPAICTHCHGGIDNQTGAPPKGLHGETLANQRAVGAHTAHLQTGYISDGVACTECHTVPPTVASPGHFQADSIAEITWGALAGSASVWNRTTNRCSSTYCHGNFSGGYASNAPIWTAPGQAACGSCHNTGTSPGDLGGRHSKHVTEENLPCQRCHAATVDAQLNIVGKNRHVDGHRDVVFSTGQGSYSNGTCSNFGCHDPENWYSP
jgi:predicted CxxxxCH...CXXCH cytochrome family protein